MSELGIRLKNAREEKKITLEQLQEITKIQKRYLLAIEEGKLDTLPGHFYARAFVKNYAEAVGLDPEMIFTEHANELPAAAKHVSDIPPRVKSRKSKGEKRASKLLAKLPTVFALFFILAIFLGTWLYFQGRTTVDEGIPRDSVEGPVEGDVNEDAFIQEEDEVEQPTDTQEDAIEDEELVDEGPKQELAFVEKRGNETIYNLLHADEFQVKIELIGKSYVGIENRINNQKGNTFHASNVDGGEVLTFDFSDEETILFNFGASNNVHLFINEELFEFPQDIVHQKVTFNFLKQTEQ